MYFDSTEISKALKELAIQYMDEKVNNSKNVEYTEEAGNISNQIFEHLSMKRSFFNNVNYCQCLFANIAFNGSTFHKIKFKNTSIKGSSLACCEFIDTLFSGNTENKGNNYSQTNFLQCSFQESTYTENGFLQNLFNHSYFSNTIFKSCTFEGSQFINCNFESVNFGNANMEFTSFLHCHLNKVTFPFYQFAYIIGAAEYIQQNADIILKVNQKNISLAEYKTQIQNLIIFYYDKADYFPICNLYIGLNNLAAATDALLCGINSCHQNMNFRMLLHYCRLAKRHNLLNEFTSKRISRTIDTCLLNKDISPEKLHDCLSYAGEIRQILQSGKQDAVELNIRIQTNIAKENQNGITYINSLSNELNTWLSQNTWGHEGFQVAVSNHSPFEIVIQIISAAGAIASVASFIWGIIINHKTDAKSTENTLPQNYLKIDPEMRKMFVDTRIDLCKEQLRNLNKNISNKKMNQYIEEITQQLKTDLIEFYDNDIMIYQKENNNDKN